MAIDAASTIVHSIIDVLTHLAAVIVDIGHTDDQLSCVAEVLTAAGSSCPT